jgi:hypothetical protein
LADVELLEPLVAVERHELADLAPEFVLVEGLGLLAHAHHLRGGVVALAVADEEEDLEQVLLHRRAGVPDHAEVEQRDPAVVRDEHVSRVGIGVEEAVDEDLLQVGPEQLLGEGRPLDVELAPGVRAS